MLLILNCGSQSIKWKLFGDDLVSQGEGSARVLGSKAYGKALIAELAKVEKLNKEISAIGHRFVHGGNDFLAPIIIRKDNLKKLQVLGKLAPLHNPFNILGIRFSQSVFPKAKQIAVFDTEFFGNLPEKASVYPLPEKLTKRFNIKKFGFHGISHEYVALEGARIFQKPIEDIKIITCHLGGGSSICAIKDGRAVETSMGFTPLDGLVMMTRPGAIDPGLVLFLEKKVKNLEDVLNYESGLKGICGLSDMREILEKVGDKRAGGAEKQRRIKLALDIFVYSVQKYIGAYCAVLGGCDLLVFTGAIGSGSAEIVKMICNSLYLLKDTRVLSIKTDEELAIAQKVKNLI